MTELYDFTKLTPKAFWQKVDKDAKANEQTVCELFQAANTRVLSPDEAIEGLNALFLHSHWRIRAHSKKLANVYPTKQLTKNRLLQATDGLWWVDHFTAGINVWSTLNWFSAQKNKAGKYNGASTHFVLDYTGYPFYIIPLMHGAWHEPRRNRDSIGIEMVNPGVVKQDHKGRWCYWPKGYTQVIPKEILLKLQPQRITTGNRSEFRLPFPAEQIRNNVLLKRIVLAAYGADPQKLIIGRFSQHSDWRDTKPDMGLLWPLEDVNSAAADTFPIEQYSLLSKYDTEAPVNTPDDMTDETENPEYGTDTPTNDSDPEDNSPTVLEMSKVQLILGLLGYRVAVDGQFGPKTRDAVRRFQTVWNNRDSEIPLKVDGIPGPKTCQALLRAEKEL